MANRAIRDSSSRTVKVNTKKLIDQLILNKGQHVEDYIEAIEGYKEQAYKKINEAYEKAKQELANGIKRANLVIDQFDEKQPVDYFQIVKGINLELTVPRNYSKEYDAAIDMFTWEVNEEVELTNAEFQCFVRNVWDWTDEFETIATSYKVSK